MNGRRTKTRIYVRVEGRDSLRTHEVIVEIIDVG